uniref:Ovule protein n=1 Tax=Romanomermis culicivorax TaxID=13658 RepID=A0A915IHU7_ROMCU
GKTWNCSKTKILLIKSIVNFESFPLKVPNLKLAINQSQAPPTSQPIRNLMLLNITGKERISQNVSCQAGKEYWLMCSATHHNDA